MPYNKKKSWLWLSLFVHNDLFKYLKFWVTWLSICLLCVIWQQWTDNAPQQQTPPLATDHAPPAAVILSKQRRRSRLLSNQLQFVSYSSKTLAPKRHETSVWLDKIQLKKRHSLLKQKTKTNWQSAKSTQCSRHLAHYGQRQRFYRCRSRKWWVHWYIFVVHKLKWPAHESIHSQFKRMEDKEMAFCAVLANSRVGKVR